MNNLNITLEDFPSYDEMVADGWKQTDPDSNQYCKTIIENEEYEFVEERIIHPITLEKELYQATINLKNYTEKEIFEYCSSYGYEKEEVKSWLDNKENIDLIAECLFESEN